MHQPKSNQSELSIEVPYAADVEAVSWGIHLNLQLSPDQTNTLRRIAEGLDRQRATLANGRRVVTPSDAIRYLLEQGADKVGS